VTVRNFAVFGRSSRFTIPDPANLNSFTPEFSITTAIWASWPVENSLVPEREAESTGLPAMYCSPALTGDVAMNKAAMPKRMTNLSRL
jgi:hypothetical protein